jgi:hypothetical protein
VITEVLDNIKKSVKKLTSKNKEKNQGKQKKTKPRKIAHFRRL